MYIDRKGWDIQEIFISLNLTQTTDGDLVTTISRDISFSSTVSADIKDRLLVIADKCPVSKILKNQVLISTTI
jgi:putative redox protein